jgi:hypothetical protein
MGRSQHTKPLKSAIHIIGEGLTEYYYFTHLKNIFHFTCKVSPRLCQQNSMDKIEKKVKEVLNVEGMAICVFDADVSKHNEKEKEKLQRFKSKYENNEHVVICDSLQSIEYWFLLHFENTTKHFRNASTTETALKKHIPNYEKSENFLSKSQWVVELLCQLELAKSRAKQSVIPIEKSSYTRIYKAIDELEKGKKHDQ